MQPMEFRDFSGGLTDQLLQCKPNQYAKADNFWLTTEARLEVRSGTRLYGRGEAGEGTYYLPGNVNRVAGLFTGINETCLFGHANRDLFVAPRRQGLAWEKINGPTGNEALSAGDRYAQVSRAEFQRQVYYTSNAGALPGKIFRDQNNEWKAVTAGLPRMAFVPNYPTDGALLAACITLANAFRTSMVDHFNDAGAASTYQHEEIDKWSLSYFVAQVWAGPDPEYPGPTPAPTPAEDATDMESLQTLCVALALAYEHHRNDLAGATPEDSASSPAPEYYHKDIALYPNSAGAGTTNRENLGINVRLTRSGAATSLPRIAAFLDELYQKWYWHQLSPFSHAADNDLTQISRYLLAESKIGAIYSSPYTLQVSPNYDEFCAYAQYVKNLWNGHVNNSGSYFPHGQIHGPITLDDPDDYDSAALTIFWARWIYGTLHYFDLSFANHTNFTFDSTSGSANITDVKSGGGPATYVLPVGAWIVTLTDCFNDTLAGNKRAARVTASAAGTATLSRTASGTFNNKESQHSTSWAHMNQVGHALVTTTTYAPAAGEELPTPGSVGTGLESWIDLATEFFTTMTAHLSTAGLSPAHSAAGTALAELGTVPQYDNPFYIPEVTTLAYAGIYKYRYTVEPNGIQYLVLSAPVYSNSIETFASFPVGTLRPANAFQTDIVTIREQIPSVTITGLPELANTSITNYDTTVSVAPTPTAPGDEGFLQNLTLNLYRTTDGGTTLYFLDELENGTTSYEDTTNADYPADIDDALSDRATLYTTGGVVASDAPPKSKFIHSFGGFTYFGGITDTGQFFPNRIRQSVQGAPDWAPATFFDDLDDELVGISSTKSVLLGLCKNSIYRVTGSFNSSGQGGMSHDAVADSKGCLSTASIVKTEDGVFFAGTDGFYHTDGYTTTKLSLNLDPTYARFTKTDAQKSRIYGTYDKLQRRVYWAMQSSPNGSDNDVFFIFYLNYGVKAEGVFGKMFTNESWMPASACFFKGELVIGDSRGYLFVTDPYTKTDPEVDVDSAVSDWGTVQIPYNFTTGALDFGTAAARKYATRLHLTGQNLGNFKLQINSINGMGRNPSGTLSRRAFNPISYSVNPSWGDAAAVWGNEDCIWGASGMSDVWRRFPRTSLRYDFKQLEFVPHADLKAQRLQISSFDIYYVMQGTENAGPGADA